MAVDVDQMVLQFVSRGLSGFERDLKIAAQGIDTVEGRAARMSSWGDKLIGFGAAGAGALAVIGGAALKTSGDMQATETGFKTMLGGVDAAKAKVAELQKFAATTPFDFAQSAKAAQTLLAMGFAGDELIPIMRAVGNAVAAGGGSTEAFTSVLMQLGQINTKGRLSSEELNAMAERGIPVFRILGEQLGLTQAQLQNIGNEGIAAATAIPALLKGMGEIGGGKAMEDQLTTLPGKISNLTDTFTQLKGTVGDAFSDEAIAKITQLTNGLEKLNQLAKDHPGAVKGIGMGLGVAAVGAVGLGVYYKAVTMMGNLKTAKDALKKSVVAEAAEEVNKTGIAGAENSALQKVGSTVEGNTAKVGAFARAQALMRAPIGGGLSQLSAFGKGGGAMTGGTAAMAAGLGLVAGVSATNNMQAAGYSDAESRAYGVVTGVGAAAVAAWVPGGAVAVAVGEGLAWGFNTFVNKPMEAKAEAGTGFTDEETKNLVGATDQEKAEAYGKLKEKAFAEGDEVSAESFQLQQRYYTNRARKPKPPPAPEPPPPPPPLKAKGRVVNTRAGRKLVFDDLHMDPDDADANADDLNAFNSDR